MATAFISYSRKDTDFVRRVYAALEEHGLAGWVDWEGIPPADDWLRKVHAAIESADAFVFVMSPDSLASTVCADEVAHAVKHNKRLIPLVLREVNRVDHPDIEIPEALRRLNWIFFRATDDFGAAAEKLVAAVLTDLEWVESHTRLLGRAIEWQAARRDDSFLLQKNDLVAAEQWLARAPDRDPKPTALQSDFIIASRTAATRRQRRLTAAAVAATVLVGIGAAVATVQYVIAEIRREEALSRQLAAQSAATLDEAPELGLLLGVYAHDVAPTAEAAAALLSALDRVRGVRAFLPGEYLPGTLTFSPDGALLAVGRCAGEGEFRCTRSGIDLWRVGGPEKVATVEVGQEVSRLAFAGDAKRLAATACCESKEERTRALVFDLAGDAGAVKLVAAADTLLAPGQEPSAAAQFADQAGMATTNAMLERVRRAAGARPADVRAIPADLAAPGRVLAVVETGALDAPVGLELWDVAGGQRRLGRVVLRPGTVWEAAVRRDGRLAAAFACAIRASGRICDAGELAIIDATAEPVRVATVAYDLPDWVRSLAPLPNANLVLTGGCGKHDFSRCLYGELRLWRIEFDDGKPRGYEPVRTFGGAVDSIALSADGRSMALTSQRGKVTLMRIDGSRASERGWLASPLESRFAALAKPEARPALKCGKQFVWNAALLKASAQLEDPAAICAVLEGFAPDWRRTFSDEWLAVAASASGARLAVGGCTASKQGSDECESGRAVVWSIADRRIAKQATVETTGGATSLALSADGSRLAVASCRETLVQVCSTGRIELVDLAAPGQPRRTLGEGLGAVTAVALRPGGETLAYSTCARLDDAGAARECALAALRFIGLGASSGADATLTGHRGTIVALAFNPAGTLLASGASDGSVALWDPVHRERLGPTLAAHALPVEAVGFVSGEAFVSTTEADEIEWRATPAQWKSAACRIANRALTEREHARFVGAGEPYGDPCAAGSRPRGSALWRWVRGLAGPVYGA